MSETLNQTLVFDVQMGAIRGDAQARSAIEAIAAQAMGAGTIKGIKSSVGVLERDMKRVVASAFKSGMRTEGRELVAVFREGRDAIIKAREQVARIDQQILMATDRAHRGRLMKDREELRREIVNREAATKNQIDMLDAQSQRAADMLETASRNASRNWQDSVKKSGEAFSGLVENALNMDNMDPSQMVKNFGKNFESDMAPKLAKFGAKHGGKGGMMGGLGKAASALASSAAAIAGAAAAIGALVAIFAAAYAQTKKLNSALMEGTAAADMLNIAADRGRDFADVLAELRNTALDTAYAFRMSGEEVSQMINQINEAGLQINEWKDYTKGAVTYMSDFASVTHQAFVASKVFGTSVSEISGFTGTMFHEMGKGLERVDEGFRMIFAGAQRSSMSTKQFFTSVTEASSGMALYNFRLDDTVGLLLNMTEVLGEDLASSQSRMAGQYRNMGMEQRIQTVMNAGGSGVSANIMGAELALQATEFGGNLGSGALAPDLMTALGGLVSSRTVGSGAGAFQQHTLDTGALGNMTETEFGDMLYQVRQQAGGDAIAMQLESMVGLARGSQGGLTNVATNLGSLGRQGELVQQLMEGRTLLGDAGVSSFEGLNRQAYENITGRSGEDFEILQRIDRDLRAEYRAGGGQDQLGNFETWAVGALGENGTLDREAMIAMPVMERLAREQMMETRSISQTLSNVIADALNGIWGLCRGIFNWGAGPGRQGALDTNESLQAMLSDQLMDLYDQIGVQNDIISDGDSTAPEIEGALAAKASLEEQLANDLAEQRLLTAEYRQIAAGQWTGSYDNYRRVAAGPQVEENSDNWASTPDEAFAAGQRSPSATLDQANVGPMATNRAALLAAVTTAQEEQGDAYTGLTPENIQDDEFFEGWVNRNRDTLFPSSGDPFQDMNRPRYFTTGNAGESWEHVGPNNPRARFQNPGDDPLWSGGGGMPTGVQRSTSASHQDSRGWTVRPHNLGDMNETQMGTITEAALAGTDMVNDLPTDLANTPGYVPMPGDLTDDFLSPFLPGGSYYGGGGSSVTPESATGIPGIASEDVDDLRAWVAAIEAEGDAQTTALDSLGDSNTDVADNTSDILGVSEDQVDMLDIILAQLREDSDIKPSEMLEMSGMGREAFMNNMLTQEGRTRIAQNISRRGHNTGRGMDAQVQLRGEAQDFIWRPGGGLAKFSSNDTIFGLKGRGKRDGMGGGVVININGGDANLVYQTVRRALKTSGKA